jgi:hypothetical protein
VVLLTAMVGAGCGTKTGNVSGTVTYKGERLPTGSVTFVDAGKQPVGTSAIQDGKYSIGRVPVGPVTILVSTPPLPNARNVPPPPPPRNKMPPKGQGTPEFSLEKQKLPPPIVVSGKYANPEESDLTYTVQPGDQVHNIPLP